MQSMEGIQPEKWKMETREWVLETHLVAVPSRGGRDPHVVVHSNIHTHQLNITTHMHTIHGQTAQQSHHKCHANAAAAKAGLASAG